MTATGCKDTAFDIMKGCRMLDSICWTTRMITSMMIAFVEATINGRDQHRDHARGSRQPGRERKRAAKNVMTPIR